MAGALKYMSDHENRLRRFKSNLLYIFDKVGTALIRFSYFILFSLSGLNWRSNMI